MPLEGEGQRPVSIQRIHFDQSEARYAIYPAHQRGVGARGQRPDERRFVIVARRNGGGDDLCFLVAGQLSLRPSSSPFASRNTRTGSPSAADSGNSGPKRPENDP